MNKVSSEELLCFSKSIVPSTVLSLWVFATLIVLSGLSCILGTFYDDEIFNIRRAALSFSNIFDYVRYINSDDIHPPVSFLLNKLAFDALGNWKAVQFVNGTLNAAAIAWFHRQTVDKVAMGERLGLTFVLATAATSVMWGTGLRWYAYFNPIFLFLYTVSLSKTLSFNARAAILAIGTVFLFHTSYLTMMAAPVLWSTFIVRSLPDIRSACVFRIVLILFATAIACLPQFYVMLTVHLHIYISSNTFPILYSIAQPIATLALGNAVFPIDYVPALFLLLLSAAFAFSIKSILRDSYATILLSGILLGLILLVVTPPGVEGRNAAFLYPIGLTLIVLIISRSASWIRLPAMASLVLLQVTSVYDVVFHHNTAKGSFNTPFAQTMQEIANAKRKCQGRTYVFTHDPVLTYLIEETGDKVSSFYVPSEIEMRLVHKKDCIVVVRTYRGTMPFDLFSQFGNQFNSEAFHKIETINIGYDRFHTIKAWIGHEPSPRYYVAIESYDVLRDTSVSD